MLHVAIMRTAAGPLCRKYVLVMVETNLYQPLKRLTAQAGILFFLQQKRWYPRDLTFRFVDNSGDSASITTCSKWR